MKPTTQLEDTGRHLAALVSLPSDDRCRTSQLIETGDLRKRSIYKDPAVPSPYGCADRSHKASTALPIGTQARFIAAASTAARAGHPLNTLLTLRWASLFEDGDVKWLQAHSESDRIAKLVERLRKWLAGRDLPPFYIWVREATSPEDEHWHMAFHAPKRLRKALINYVAGITGEVAAKGRRPDMATSGEFAVGEASSWHLAGDIHPERAGYFLAAYLGKGEPSQRVFRGKLMNNVKKPVRGQRFGGDRLGDKYDSDQGLVIGTTYRGKRFNIYKQLKIKSAASPKGRVSKS